MAFLDRLRESGTTLFFYCRISGLPHIWSNVPLPSAWESAPGQVELDGETYAHHSTLLPGRTWASVEDKAEPWTGLATASQLELDFMLPGTPDFLWETSDAWMQLLASSHKRHAAAPVLTEDLAVAATTATVSSTETLTESGEAYIGTETVSFAATTRTALTGMTRGLYGSRARYHSASIDSITETGSGGPYVTQHSPVMAGRICELWIGTGYTDPSTGELVPYGAAIDSAEDRQIYAGVVRHAAPDKLAAVVRVEVEGLRSLLATEVCKRQPRATAGYGTADAPIYVSDANNRIAWRWFPAGADGLALDPGTPIIPPAPGPYRATLQRDDGGGTTEVVPDGWYSRGTLSTYLTWTMTVGTHDDGAVVVPGYVPVPAAWTVELFSLTRTDGQRWVVLASTTDTGSGEVPIYALELLDADKPQSFWRCLGFESSLQAVSGDGGTSWGLPADRLAALFWLPPAPWGSGHQIAYRGHTGPAFTAAPGWVDAAGNAVKGYVRLGEEVIRVDATGTSGAVHYLQIGAREQLGSSAAEEIYIEQDPEGGEEIPKLVQGLVFPETLWGDAALYLTTMMDGAAGNGPEDLGWRGGGAAIPAGLIDVPSWSLTAAATDGLRSVAIFEATSLESVLARCLVPSQACITATFDADSGQFQLVAIDMRPPLEHEAAAGAALDTSNLVTLDGPGLVWEVDESGVVNVIVADGIGYDHGQDMARQRTTWQDVTSVGTWGEARPLEVDLRDVEPGDVDAGVRRLVDLAQRLAAQYSRPFLVLQLSVALPEVGWRLEIGDEVSITHPLILQHATVGRGVTGLAARVYGVRKTYRDTTGKGVAAVVTCIAAGDGTRFCGWAPCAVAHTLPSTTVLECYDHWDSYDGDALVDAEYFPVGSKVRIANIGDEANGVLRTVVANTPSGTADSSTIEVDTAHGLTAPVIVEPADYDDAGTTDAHRAYAYLSDGDGVLDTPTGGTDTAYEYL